MSKPTKVPRATLAITMLDDPEFIGLCQTPEGREAYALFTALLMAAKDQDNGGKFTQDSAVLAMMVRWPVEAFRKALALLQDKTNWLVIDASLVQIRSYKKWNSWGGNRDGAGRPIKPESSGNQDVIKTESRPDVLVFDVDVASKEKTKTPASDKPKRIRKPTFADSWLPEFRKLLGFELDDASACIAINKFKAISGERVFIDTMKDLKRQSWLATNKDHLWKYMNSCLRTKLAVAKGEDPTW